MSRLHADIALLFAAAVWGIAFVFQKSAMDHIGPLAFIAARGVVAALALAPLALREHRRAPKPAGKGFWAIAVWGGGVFFVAAWLQQAGIVTATVTNTGFLTALYVVITPFIAWGWSSKVPSAVVWPAVALSAIGTWLLGGGTLSAFSWGDQLVALSALFWAIHVVVTGRASPHGRPVAYTAIQFAVVACSGAARQRADGDHDAARAQRCRDRHRLRRPAVERSHLHDPDAGPAAHPSVGGSRDREHGDRVRRAGGLPAARRAPRRPRLDRCGPDPLARSC